MFTDQLTRAIASARTPRLDHLSAAGTEAVRAARSRTRRRLHEPRPTATPEINARIGQWKNNIKAACLAGYIGQSYDKYLHELLTISSVARGDYCLYSDKEMAQRLNLRGDGSRTVRRHRAAATKQGLLEVLGHGKDRKPCMVRPILRDGSPPPRLFHRLPDRRQNRTFCATLMSGGLNLVDHGKIMPPKSQAETAKSQAEDFKRPRQPITSVTSSEDGAMKNRLQLVRQRRLAEEARLFEEPGLCTTLKMFAAPLAESGRFT
jgi:hypothetical protein